MNKIILISCTILIAVFTQTMGVSAATGEVILGSPATISFTGITASPLDQEITYLSTGTGNMFWLEDLKSSASGYHVTLSAEDMIDEINTGNIISKTFIDAKIGTGITILSGGPSSGVTIPEPSSTGFTSIGDNQITIIERNIDVSGTTGKYAITPYFKIRVPAYQSIGSYKGVIIYTLIEH